MQLFSKLTAASLTLFCLLAPSYASTPITSDPGGGGGAGGNAASSPGPTYPWVGSVDDTSTATGNKSTSIGIVSWTQRGGLPVDLALSHNSESSHSSELGPKWLTSYDDTLSVDASGNVTVYWGDGRVYTFGNKLDGSYTLPPGIHDTLRLLQFGRLPGSTSPPTYYYSLTTKDQITYQFNPGTAASTYNIAKISDENSNVIQIGYVGGTNLVQTVSDATGRTVRLSYANNKLMYITDPLNRQWTLTYDSSGRLAHVYFPAVSGATYSANIGYDSNSNITSYQDMRGNTSNFSYNPANNSLAWVKDNLGNQTTFTYGSPFSYDTTITDPNGNKAIHVYTNGRLAQVNDALGYNEYYSYDTDNNVTQKQDRRGYYWNYTYDGMGNVLTAKDPNSNTTTYTYNAHNKPLTITLPLGRSVAGTYDNADNLALVQQKDAAGNVAAATSFTIGSYGLVSDKYDPNNHHTSYTYDANGNLSSTITPEGHQTQWTYDALGFQTSRTDAMSRTTNYTPDAWERLVTTTYSDSTTHTFAYDANSNLTAWADPSTGSWSRAYDPDNRILAEANNGVTQVSHTYDASGQKGLLSTTTDGFGRTLTYAYSARNELAAVSEPASLVTYTYDADGNQIHLFLPNGRTDDIYNADGTLYEHNNYGGSTLLAAFGYFYNADHQLTIKDEGTSTNVNQNGIQTLYGYDALGHLTSESRNNSNPYSRSYTCWTATAA